ncbi:MAG: tripartite tricarboxylate transporter permease [Rhodospirillales bacterium]|jgi:putative tricarboxylic transport membrane protein|nr:C4-dicarboxylate ABC transporter permease [Rhodospirillaceae bacterium]MDP6643272.1 tripartite tricarboxylate transporter permease [Rhodospirillales bacterium]MDP6843368.1 tripartite tricarboxylate transporter permease [Rhodospirillales bacterium]|tara:strand:- start:1602 stop:3107 length:1506 start_codon:yes stop_codon:yes gene_type:complete
MNPDIIAGFTQASMAATLAATAVGCLLGLVVGMIPGMTISTGIIIVLPLTFVLPPDISIALLLGLYVSGMTGGSFSAILLNIPGTPSASATALDGHPMAARGDAGRALGLAITASFIGGVFSFLCLYFIAPLLAELALKFQSPDLFSLVFFGLTIICSFAAQSLVKGLLSALIGLMIVTIGQDPMMGTARFTFDQVNLIAGIHFLTALIGLFAIPQLVDNLSETIREQQGETSAARIQRVLPRLSDLKALRLPVSIGAPVGAFLGILPGAGGPIAAFISYDYAKKLNKRPEKFGDGAPEGIAAPEAANNAVTGGALIPMMTLGIPGDPVTAILIGALLIHGLAPGPLLFLERGDFAYGIIFSFFWANIFNIIIALLGLRLLVKVLAMPKSLLMPIIAILCVIGSYALRNNFFDVYVMFGFGLLGLAMRWLDMPVVPLLLALVLGRPLEEHLRVSLVSSQGDVSIFFTSPFSLFFLVMAAVSVFWSFYMERRTKKTADAPME